MGWGEVLGKIFEWIPGRKEYYRAKITKIKQKMDLLVQQRSTVARRREYKRLADQLWVYEEKIRNI